MKFIFSFLLLVLMGSAHAQVGVPLEGVPMQDAGRIKPFETFARESMRLIHGKETFEGKPAVEVVFTWLLIPQHWMDTPIIELRHHGLKEAMQITSEEKYFSANAILSNPRLNLVVQDLQNQRSRQEKLNPYFQSVQRLENQLYLFQAVRTGAALRFVPSPTEDAWIPVNALEGDVKDAFARVSKGFVESISGAAEGQVPRPTDEFRAAVAEFEAKARAHAPDKYADATRIKVEMHLNHAHPFKWAWIAYLLGLLCLAGFEMSGWRGADRGMTLFTGLGFFLHAYGMALRVYLAGRPPVSNMYETVVWVPWGCVLFGIILAVTQKNRFVLASATAIAIFCLNLTDLAPAILDSSIQPLEPVLRSTFWLSTHVLIISISYAAFFLAFAIGDLNLFFFWRDEKRFARQIKAGTHAIYRALQIGIVLLAFGIILGGIWADYSWGRFWGWDPKETWALIALLGYIALLHGRLIGWVRDFQLAAGAIIAFSLVIMAWYGVNMVLGAGLHTYGFGAGGIVEVGAFVSLHILYVVYVSTLRWVKK